MSIKKAFFKYKNRILLITISTLTYLTTTITLLIVQYNIFATTFNFFNILLIITPPLCIIAQFFIGKNERCKNNQPILLKIIQQIVLFALLILLIVLIIKNPYDLISYQLSILTLISILLNFNCIFKLFRINNNNEKDITILLITLFHASILVTTIIYLIVTKPCGVGYAKNKIEFNGYNNVKLVERYTYIKPFIDNKDISYDYKNKGDNLGYYLFKANKNETGYYIIINAINGDVFAEVKQSSYQSLHDILEIAN